MMSFTNELPIWGFKYKFSNVHTHGRMQFSGVY